jgi:TolB-like protein/Tfp pilus assembly protein PilF
VSFIEATPNPPRTGGSHVGANGDAARWSRIKGVFAAALEKDPASRAEFVAQACGDDAALHTEIESLLKAHGEVGRILDFPASLPGSPPTLEAGTRIGPYEILAPLAAGGMGEVYRARDARLGREVAIKMLAVAGNREEATRRFELEARAIAALNHPNVLAVYDVGTYGGNPYIVSELLRGHTLREALQGGRLPLREALEYASQLAEGISAAHEQGIVHRDLKPENLFLTSGGTIKILDFGIAKLIAEQRGTASTPDLKTQTGVLLGTIAYMSPEQLRGQSADQRSDIFSFGAVLYEMLAGQPAFAGASSLERAHAIVSDEPRPLPDDVPDQLQRVVHGCLCKDPSARWPSAKNLVEQLTAASVAISTGAAGRARTRLTGTRITALLLGIGAVAAGAGVILVQLRAYNGSRTVTASAPAPAASIAVLRFADMSAAKDQQYFSDGVAESILDALAHIDRLRVAGRTSSFSFDGKGVPANEIARALNVAYLLEGSVRRDDGRVRITVQLIDADGYHVWSQTYDHALTGIFDTQDEISRAVVEALKVRLAAPSAEAPRSKRATSPQAYVEYLLGNQFAHRLTYDNYRRALAAYERALALDPNFAPAWAGLALVDFWAAEGAETAAALERAYSRAMAAAEKAIAIDPDLAVAYSARGYLRLAMFNWQGSRSDLERALALNPNDAHARLHHASLLASLGRLPEAVAEAQAATELEPLLGRAWSFLGRLYYSSGQLGPARAALERALRIDPEQSYAPLHLAIVSLLEKRPSEALSFASRSSAAAFRLPVEAAALHDLGRQDEADQKLGSLIARFRHFGAYEIADVYAWFGDLPHAFEWLKRASENRDPGLANIKFDVALRNVRGDPRFHEMLRKMDLPLD